jgi:hypothetical protein
MASLGVLPSLGGAFSFCFVLIDALSCDHGRQAHPCQCSRHRNLPLVGANQRLKPGKKSGRRGHAQIVAERLVAQLERSGFVIMRKPIPVGHPR